MTRPKRGEPIVATNKITYDVVNALENWRTDTIDIIRRAVANESSDTSTEVDQRIAESVFTDLLGAQALVLPEVEE